MGELGALFNPGMRHELEERRAKAARREEEGNARDGDLRIDLDSGVAVINTPGEEADSPGGSDATESAAPAGSEDPAESGGGAAIRSGADGAVDTAAVGPAADGDDDDASSRPATAPLRPRGKRATAAGKR